MCQSGGVSGGKCGLETFSSVSSASRIAFLAAFLAALRAARASSSFPPSCVTATGMVADWPSCRWLPPTR